MEGIWAWAKDNYDLIGWIVGLIGVVIAVISLLLELKKKRRDKINDSIH